MTKLLIVDDEPLTVDMLQTFLQINGYETIGALNGEDGLVMVQVEQPEMMILDLMLPDIEGFEVCRRIRTLPDYARYAGIPVLVLSARIEESSRKRAMEVGANAYLTKPVKFPDLLAELRRLAIDEQAAAVVPVLVPSQPVVVTPPEPAILESEKPPVSQAGAVTPVPVPSQPVVVTPPEPAILESEKPPVSQAGAVAQVPTPSQPVVVTPPEPAILESEKPPVSQAGAVTPVPTPSQPVAAIPPEPPANTKSENQTGPVEPAPSTPPKQG
jgi:CheY-like chemotaxis protein